MATNRIRRSKHYIYRIAVEDGIYVGQARSALRALDHLGASSNKRLKNAIAAAHSWPDISVLTLPKRCGGDLSIGEAVLIKVAQEYADVCFNGSASAVCAWNDPTGKQSEWGVVDPTIMSSEDGDQPWELRSEPFCHAENLKAVKSAAGRLVNGDPFPERFRFLPSAGSPLVRLSESQLMKVLAAKGHQSAFVVPISRGRSGGRITLGPDASDRDLAKRCLKWWPPSHKMFKEVDANPPTALVAVIGGPTFRIVAGAWALDTKKSDLVRGVFVAPKPSANLGRLQGKVLTIAKFSQASYPIWWLRSKCAPTWVGH